MKKRVFFLFLIFAFTLSSFVSCSREKEFTHCELTLVLNGGFDEEASEEYDLLLTDGDVMVSVMRISLEAAFETGISDTYTAKGFAAFFMNRSEKSEELLMYGDVPYYCYTEKYEGSEFFHTVTFYRSYQAYFIVGYSVMGDGASHLDRFLEYADAAYFNDAPVITTK